MASANTQIRLNPSQLKAVLAGPNGPIWQDIRQRGNRVLNSARTIVPKRTKRLQNSLTLEMGMVNDVPVARVGTNMNYALYVHQGTKPHTIRAKNKKALVFVWPNGPAGVAATKGKYKGKVVRRSVKHPGTSPRPFLVDALKVAGGPSRIVI